MSKESTPPKRSAKGALRQMPPPPKLSAEHMKELLASGLTHETIEAAGLYTERDNREVKKLLNFTRSHDFGPSLVFPYFDIEGQIVGHRVKPANPRSWKKAGGKVYTAKYESPKGRPNMLYMPPTVLEPLKGDKDRAVVLLEGEKKTLYMAQLGYVAVGASGVDCFHDAEARDIEGVKRFPTWFTDDVPTEGRTFVVCFDADVVTKREVRDASKRLAGIIEGMDARHLLAHPPEDQPLKGIDDYGAEHGAEAVAAIMKSGKRIKDPTDPHDLDAPILSIPAFRGSPFAPVLRWPRGYEILKLTGLWREGKEGEGSTQIMSRPVIPSRVLVNVDTGEERLEVMFRREGEWRSHVVERVAVKQARSIVESLANLGADVNGFNAGEVVRFIAAFEEMNESRLPRVLCSDRCGWHASPDPEASPDDRVFVAPGLVDESAGVVFAGDDGRANVIRGIGVRKGADFEAHRKALDRAIRTDPVLALNIFAALASPLIELIGAKAFLLHNVGDSSKGKSSSQRAAGSIYGNPYDRSYISTWNATAVGIEVKAATLGNLPFLVDEVGAAADSRSRAATLYQLVDGTGKARGTKTGGLQPGRRWNLVTISTGEVPIVEVDGPTGAAVRTIEVLVQGLGDLDAKGVDELVAACVEHYGAFGARWLRLLAGASVAEVGELRALYENAVERFRADAPAGSLQARQAAYWAVMAVAEGVAHGELDLGPGGLVHKVALSMAQGEAERVAPAHVRALEAIRDSIATERETWPLIGLDSSGRQVTKATTRRLAGFRRDGCAFIPASSLDAILSECGAAKRPVLAAWKANGTLEADGKGDHTTKIRVNGARVRVYAIRLEEVFDDEGEAEDDADEWGEP